jgi:hypothetical protein
MTYDTRVFIHFDHALHALYAPQNSSRGGNSSGNEDGTASSAAVY